MPNRQIINGEPYRYAYQGQEKDPETGKEAFQLRLWDGRIGRWLSPDPYGQYHSPYLGMGNEPAKKIDPDGGCTKGDPCYKLDEIVIQANGPTRGANGSLKNWNEINWKWAYQNQIDALIAGIHAEQAKYKPFLMFVVGGMVAPALPAVSSINFSASSTSSLVTQFGLKGAGRRMAYDFTSELVANDFDYTKVNMLGVTLSAFGNSKYLEFMGAGVDMTLADGIKIKTLEQTLVSLHLGKYNSRLAYQGKGLAGKFLSPLAQGYVKKGEDFINERLKGFSFFSIHKLN